jgi:hypothetical protein
MNMNAPLDPLTIPAGDLVKEYFRLKSFVEQKEKDLETALAPYKAGIATIKNTLLLQLNAANANSFNTDFGTPYKSVILKPKVVDKTAFIKCVVDNWTTVGEQLINATAAKEGVGEWMEKDPNKLPPPGVTVEFFTNLNIRSS